jgi:hypothetical protein
MKRAVSGRDTDTLAKCGLKNGDMLHINNEGVTLTQLTSAAKFKPIEEIKQEKEEKAKSAKLMDSSGRVIKAVEKLEETDIKDSYGKVIKAVVKEEK